MAQNKNTKTTTRTAKLYRMIWWTLGVVVLVGVVIVSFFVLQGKHLANEYSYSAVIPHFIEKKEEKSIEFPVGVDPKQKVITENTDAETYFETYIAPQETAFIDEHTTWFGRVLGKLALMNWYQNLASLTSRILVIQSGERKEQIADNFGQILKWNTEQKNTFLSLIENNAPELEDGKFYPGSYTVAKNATPEDVAMLVQGRFSDEVLQRYTEHVSSVVPLDQALTIASLLEREAYDFQDMQQISGVIWNRLFSEMRLQIDATLQYAKGSKTKDVWWPKVLPGDKNIASVYNTYKNTGLPPAPIANPSLEAILAALNPKKTDCMYYFHDKHAGFHCSKTYNEHVESLKKYYGSGK